MLFPSSRAPIIRSRAAERLETIAASSLPCFESRSMLAREAPVSAVSLAAKNADTKRQNITMENVIQSMCVCHLSGSSPKSQYSDSEVRSILRRTTEPSRQPGFEKIANHRRLDIRSDHGATDRLEQDKGETSALDLLVLRHQRH